MSDLEKKIIEENKKLKSSDSNYSIKFKIFKKNFNKFLAFKRSRSKYFQLKKQERYKKKQMDDLYLDCCEMEYVDFLDIYEPEALGEYEYIDEYISESIDDFPMVEQGLLPDFGNFFIDGERDIVCTARYSEIFHTENGPLVKKTRVFEQDLCRLKDVSYIGFLKNEKSGMYQYVRTTRLESYPVVKVQYKSSVREKDYKFNTYESEVVQLHPKPIDAKPEPEDKIHEHFADEVFKLFIKSAMGEENFFNSNGDDMEF